MKLYDEYGVRTPLGIGLSAFVFIVATISAFSFVPATGWAVFAPFGCEMACSSGERYWIALVMICPIMLATAAVLGFRAALGQLSAFASGLSLISFICAAVILAVDLGYVR
jgi:hypothetical protein